MDSADCCSSSLRSRTPSPRNSASLALGVFLLAWSAGSAFAAPASAGVASVRADSLRHRSRPFFVMLRSAAVPGWGQLYNHKYVKAGVVIGGEGFLAFLALNELKKENQAV